MEINILTKADLEQLKEELLQEIQVLLSKKEKPKKWLKASEVKVLLGISDNTLRKMMHKGLIRSKKIMGQHYFESKELEKMFD